MSHDSTPTLPPINETRQQYQAAAPPEEEEDRVDTPPPSYYPAPKDSTENTEGIYYPTWVRVTPKKKDTRPKTPDSIMRTPLPPIRPSPSIVKIADPVAAPLEKQVEDLETQEQRARHRYQLEEQRDRTKILCEMLESESEKNSEEKMDVQEAEQSAREAILRNESLSWMLAAREAGGSLELAKGRATARVLSMSTALLAEEEKVRPTIEDAEVAEVVEIVRWEKVHRPWSMEHRRPLVPTAPKGSKSGGANATAMIAAPPSTPPQDQVFSYAFRGRRQWAQEKADRYEAKKHRNRKAQLDTDQTEARMEIVCDELKAFMAMQQAEISNLSYAKKMQAMREHEEQHGTDLASGNPTPETIERRKHAAARKIQRVGRRYNAKQDVVKRQQSIDETVKKQARQEDAVLVCQRAIRSCLARCRRTKRFVDTAARRETDIAFESLDNNILTTQTFAHSKISTDIVTEAVEAAMEAARKFEEEKEAREQERVAWEMRVEKMTKLGVVAEMAKKNEEDTSLPFLELLLEVQDDAAKNPVVAPMQESALEDGAAAAQATNAPTPKAPYRAIEWLSKAIMSSAPPESPTHHEPKEGERMPPITPIGECGFSLLSLIRSAVMTAEAPLPDACRVLVRSNVPVPEHHVHMMIAASPTKPGNPEEGDCYPSDTQYAALESLLAQNRAGAAAEKDDGIPFSEEYVKDTIWDISNHHRDIGTFVELNPIRTEMYEDKNEFEAEEIKEMENHEMLNRERLIEEQIDIFLDEMYATFAAKREQIRQRDEEEAKIAAERAQRMMYRDVQEGEEVEFD